MDLLELAEKQWIFAEYARQASIDFEMMNIKPGDYHCKIEQALFTIEAKTAEAKRCWEIYNEFKKLNS